MSGESNRRTRWEIVVGTLWSAFSWAISVVAGPVIAVVLVRRMTRDQFGDLAAATSAVGVATAFAGLGLQQALSRYAAITRAERGREGLTGLWREARTAIVLASTVAAVSAVVLLVLPLTVAHLRPSLAAVAWSLPGLLVTPLAGAAGGFLRGAFRPRWTALAGAAGPLAAAAVIVPAVVLARPSAALVAAGRMSGALVTALILLIGVVHLRRAAVDDRTRGGPDPVGAARSPRATGAAPVRQGIVTFGMAMLLASLFGTIVAELGVALVSAARGTHTAAIFAPAAAVAALVLAVPGLIAGFLLPGLSPAAERGERDEVARLFHWSSRWQMVLLAPPLAVLLVCPGDLLRVLFGAGLVGGTSALRVLGLGCAMQMAFGFNGLAFSAFGEAKLLFRLQWADLLVAVGAITPAALTGGMLGAATAAAVVLGFSNLLYAWALWHFHRIRPANVAMALTVGAFAASCGVGWVVPHTTGSSLVRCVLVALVAALATGAVGFLAGGSGERQELFHLLSRRVLRRAAA